MQRTQLAATIEWDMRVPTFWRNLQILAKFCSMIRMLCRPCMVCMFCMFRMLCMLCLLCILYVLYGLHVLDIKNILCVCVCVCVCVETWEAPGGGKPFLGASTRYRCAFGR